MTDTEIIQDIVCKGNTFTGGTTVRHMQPFDPKGYVINCHVIARRFASERSPYDCAALFADPDGVVVANLDGYRVEPIEDWQAATDASQAEVARLRAEVERLRKDAARYRRLRESLHPHNMSHTKMPRVSDPFNSARTYTSDGLDAAIDAALASPKPAEQGAD